MILAHKFVAAGLLLVILTIFIVGVHSKATETGKKEEKLDSANKREQEKHASTKKLEKLDVISFDLADYGRWQKKVREERTTSKEPRKPKGTYYKLKRQVREITVHHGADAPKKTAHGEDPSGKAATKKRVMAANAKKPLDRVIDVDKTTTQKPKEAHPSSEKRPKSTEKPHSHRSGKKTTKTPEKKNKKEEGEESKEKESKKEDKSADVDGEEKESGSGGGKSTTQKPSLSTRKHKMRTEEKLKVANERWLQNQEVVAIEHMLAGVYDWMKVLKQTKGKTFNKKTAGELFDKVNNELASMLSEQNKPTKLVSFYRQMNIK